MKRPDVSERNRVNPPAKGKRWSKLKISIKEYQKNYYKEHKEEIDIYNKDWHKKHMGEFRNYVKEHKKKIRKECIEHYGGKCACCGEARDEFLSIDHIGGGGSKHRKELKTTTMVYWLRKNNFPEGFRVLCHNCNASLGYYGYCPHEREKNEGH